MTHWYFISLQCLKTLNFQDLEKLYGPHGRPHHLSTIPVKGSHLFKISELVFSFYLKLHKICLFLETLYSPYNGPRHLSFIPLKDFHLFKIVESVISFCLKNFFDSPILNKWKSFTGIVNHVTCPPRGPYYFSCFCSCV